MHRLRRRSRGGKRNLQRCQIERPLRWQRPEKRNRPQCQRNFDARLLRAFRMDGCCQNAIPKMTLKRCQIQAAHVLADTGPGTGEVVGVIHQIRHDAAPMRPTELLLACCPVLQWSRRMAFSFFSAERSNGDGAASPSHVVRSKSPATQGRAMNSPSAVTDPNRGRRSNSAIPLTEPPSAQMSPAQPRCRTCPASRSGIRYPQCRLGEMDCLTVPGTSSPRNLSGRFAPGRGDRSQTVASPRACLSGLHKKLRPAGPSTSATAV